MEYQGKNLRGKDLRGDIYTWYCQHCGAEVNTFTKVKPYCINSKCKSGNLDKKQN